MRCWMLVLWLALPVPSFGAACKVKALEMPVTVRDGRAITTVGIDGQDVKLMVDSGAFFSFLTDATAEQLQLRTRHLPFGMEVRGLTGEVETRVTRVRRLQLLKGEIPDVDFAVGGNEPGGGAMGLLGRNLLSFADTEYDLANGMIRLMFPEGDCSDIVLAYWAGSTPISEVALLREYRDKLPAVKATASLNGKSVRVLFDTGAMSVVSLAAALRAGIGKDEMKPAGRAYGAGRGDAEQWIAPIKVFELGGEKIQNSHLMVADFDLKDEDMLLGIDFFLSHRIYVAKGQKKIYFTYNGGPVFALNDVGASSGPAQQEGGEDPADAAGFARRAAAFAARNNPGRALADLDRACELEPAVAAHFAQRAVVRLALRQPEQAARDLDEALRLDPGAAEPRLYRAGLRQAAGDREGAIEDLLALDKVLAPQAHMRRELGRIHARLGLYDQALAQWNLWIPSHPNEVTLHRELNERCWARAMLGRELELALEDCNSALKQQPDNASYLDSRAWVRLRQGRDREAVADYDRALKIRPESSWSLYGRGIARLRQGEREPGQADLAAARQLLPSIDAEAAKYGIAPPPP